MSKITKFIGQTELYPYYYVSGDGDSFVEEEITLSHEEWAAVDKAFAKVESAQLLLRDLFHKAREKRRGIEQAKFRKEMDAKEAIIERRRTLPIQRKKG